MTGTSAAPASLEFLVVEGPDHDGVYVAGEDAPRVRRGLALAYLYLLGQQVEGVAAELVHAYLERDARAVRWLLEDHRQCPAAQGPVGDARPLQALYLEGLVEDQLRFFRGELGQREAVAAREREGEAGCFRARGSRAQSHLGLVLAHFTATTPLRKKSRA